MGFILFLTLPVFYILGIVHLVQAFTNSKKKKRATYLRQAITDLSNLPEDQKDASVRQLVQTYNNELLQITGHPIAINQLATTSPPPQLTAEAVEQSAAIQLANQPTSKQSTVPPLVVPQAPKSLSFSLSNWYSDNSVNVILYLGAFLILASAFTFVRFQSDALSRTIKGVLITLLTITFT